MDTHVTVQQRVADAKWATIEARDNPWHRVFNIVAGIVVLIIVLNIEDRSKLARSLACIAITLVFMAILNRFLIKPKRYYCSECDQKLSNDQPGQCPGCGASLT